MREVQLAGKRDPGTRGKTGVAMLAFMLSGGYNSQAFRRLFGCPGLHALAVSRFFLPCSASAKRRLMRKAHPCNIGSPADLSASAALPARAPTATAISRASMAPTQAAAAILRMASLSAASMAISIGAASAGPD